MALPAQATATMPEAFAADAHAVRAIRRLAIAFAADAGAHRRRLADIALAVSQAASNAVLHAYRDDRPSGTLTVTAAHDTEQLWITIADDGTGMTARTDSPGAGLGIALMTASAIAFRLDRRRAAARRSSCASPATESATGRHEPARPGSLGAQRRVLGIGVPDDTPPLRRRARQRPRHQHSAFRSRRACRQRPRAREGW